MYVNRREYRCIDRPHNYWHTDDDEPGECANEYGGTTLPNGLEEKLAHWYWQWAVNPLRHVQCDLDKVDENLRRVLQWHRDPIADTQPEFLEGFTDKELWQAASECFQAYYHRVETLRAAAETPGRLHPVDQAIDFLKQIGD